MSAAPEPDELHASNVVHLAPIQRRAPHAQEIEVSFVSIALIDPKRAFQAAAEVSLTKDDFYFPSHALIFEILSEFWQENEPMTSDILIMTLKARKVLEHTGGTIKGAHLMGQTFIFELETMMPTVHVAESYAAIIKEKANRRRGTTVLGTLYESGFDESLPYEEWLTAGERWAMEIVKMREGKKTHSRTMRELANRAMKRYDDRRNGEWRVDMPTGIKALDRACLGFAPATVTIILGAPSDGKSSLSTNIAEHLVLNCGKRVGIISLDDTDDEVFDRLIQQRARVNMFEFWRTGQLTADEEERIQRAAIEFGEADDRLFIRDDGALTPSQISATLTKWKSKHGLDFAIIDHIQLARQDGPSRGSTEDSNQVSRSLKPMAKQFGIPFLVLSQRTQDKDGHYKTKNTTSLQEDANRIWTISRKDEGGSTDAWINIGKQKNGPTPNVPVSYFREFTRFCDREQVAHENEQPDLVDMPASKRRTKK